MILTWRISFLGLRNCRFCGPKQYTFRNGGTIKAGFRHKFHIHKTNLFHQRQEILPRYGPALSPKPTLYPALHIVW